MISIALGTTPTILINLTEVNPRDFAIADLTIKKGSAIVITRHIDTATISDKKISWKLTQRETLSFSVSTSYKIMCNWVMSDGTRGITKESALQIIDNHENWELYPGGSDTDDDTEIIIQNDPFDVGGYVTPQQFGAKGNGVTDDTDAIQAALDADGSVYFSRGEYVISRPIVITDKAHWSMNARDAVFRYSGEGYAIRILNARQCKIEVGYVSAPNGGGIEFYSDSKNSWSQYVTLYFDMIAAKTDCVHVETYEDGWANENRVYGGQFGAGENGVNIIPHGINGLSGWKFYNCGIEGVTNGFRLDATSVDYICNMVFANCRYGESFETILKTIGTVFDCLWLAPSHIMPSYIECSDNTNRFEILAPIGTYWHMHDTAYHRGVVMGGKLMGEQPELIEVTS